MRSDALKGATPGKPLARGSPRKHEDKPGAGPGVPLPVSRGSPVEQEEAVSCWRRQGGRGGIVMMWVPQPCTVLQVTHTHSGHPWVPVLGETLLRGATARSAEPLPRGRPLSPVHEVPRASYNLIPRIFCILSREFHFMSRASRPGVNCVRMGTTSASCAFVCQDLARCWRRVSAW